MSLDKKKILVAVSGSIAAYKSALIVRLLVKSGAEVRVILTEAAAAFITPLTLSTLSKNPALTSFTGTEGEMWNNHVELGLWADALVVAPATANTLGKMARGICDNLLVATYLSARCPVFFAPAMDLDMWQHPSTLENVRLLQEYGNQMIPVGTGELASGLSGAGRMAEPEEIVAYLDQHFLGLESEQDLAGKKVIISAGPTHERLDPVRYLGNRSSGKMGIELADEAARRGAEVHLVLGPSKHRPKHPKVQIIHVESAADMYKAVNKQWKTADWCIMAAAVADYTPLTVSDKKIKKKAGDLKIDLKRTQDILVSLGKAKSAHQLLVGFALETNNAREHAQGKLTRKNLDLIVLNSLADKGAGFGHDTNKITISDRHNKEQKFELKSKKEVASDILSYALRFAGEKATKEEVTG